MILFHSNIKRAILFYFTFFTLSSYSQLSPIFLSAFKNGGLIGDANGFGTLSVLTGDASIIHSYYLPQINPGVDAYYPELVEAIDGKVYGLHRSGGNEGIGSIFEFDPITQEYIIKYEFSDSGLMGHFPEGGMISLPDGRLLGTTSSGGLDDAGIIFSYIPGSSIIHLEANMASTTAKGPSGQLLFASDGWVYGTTKDGGTLGLGTIFRFHPNTNQIQVVYDISDIGTGYSPSGGLCELADGKLYGFCKMGGETTHGVIYSFQLSTQEYQVVRSFNINGDFGYPVDGNGPILLNDTTFISVLGEGGSNGAGSLMKWSISSVEPEFLYQFSTSTGESTNGRIMKHSNGNWYWLALNFDNYAQLVEYNPIAESLIIAQDSIVSGFLLGQPFEHSSHQLVILSGNSSYSYGGEIHTYNPYTQNSSFIPLNFKYDGAVPISPLCLASDGKYYGLCSIGASPINNLGYGAGFRFNPENQTYTKLFDFEGTVVRSGSGAFVEGLPGKLYAIVVGSQAGKPRIIQYDIVTGEMSVVVNFTNQDGDIPSNGLFKASNGKLYGTTTNGGGGGSIGTLFEFDPATLQFTTRYRFNNQTIGAQPYGSLIQVAPDKLLGTTLSGGSSISGTIYEFTLSTGAVVLKQTFTGTNGSKPYGGLVDGGDGIYYGTTSEGGTANEGTIYSYDYATNSIQTRASFGAFNLNHPHCNLTKASDGWLYGITHGYGVNSDRGGLFRYNPINQQLELIKQFELEDGFGADFNHQLQEISGVLTSDEIPTILCPGSSFYVHFASNSTFSIGHVFTAELSDSDGSFINPQEIGSVTASQADSIFVTIPSSITLGEHYRIRVRSENDLLLNIDNGEDLIIGNPLSGTVQLDLVNLEPLCNGEELQFQAYIEGFNSAYELEWYVNDVSLNVSAFSYFTNSLNDGDVISIKLFPSEGCYTQTEYESTSIQINYNSSILPQVELVTPLSYCEGSELNIATISNGMGNNPSYKWYLDGQLLNVNNSVLNLPLTLDLNNQTLWVEMTSSLSCVNQSFVLSDTLLLDIHEISQTDVFVNLSEGDSIFVGGAWQYESGTYTDILTSEFGCDSIILTYVDIILGDVNQNNSNDWIFRTNIEWGTIQFGFLNSKEYNWNLFDIQGRKVNSGISNSLVELPVKELAKGVYILRINSGGINLTRKWVK